MKAKTISSLLLAVIILLVAISNHFAAAAAEEQEYYPYNLTTNISTSLMALISKSDFNKLLKYRNNPACTARGFYTYEAFISATTSFPAFATTGDNTTRKREIAAFLAQTSHETTGGWASAPGGPYAWGYCYKKEDGSSPDYCVSSGKWPCVRGKKYYGRGPIQLTYNYNYGPAGKALGVDLLKNPDFVEVNPTLSFLTALWFWMTPLSRKPSCHDVITGVWVPSSADQEVNRVPGYGVITNIINGDFECGHGSDYRVRDRIGFYKRYTELLGVSPGKNLHCGDQKPFGPSCLSGPKPAIDTTM